jgi:hypothetical protein
LATLATYSNLTTTGGAYVLRTFNLNAYRGTSVRIYFLMNEDVTLQTSFVVDDTALTIN